MTQVPSRDDAGALIDELLKFYMYPTPLMLDDDAASPLFP